MNELLSNLDLSKYNKYILNKIIKDFAVNADFNIYELVKESVSYKCILPSQNELIMDTYYTIKECLVVNGFIVEQKEMTSYLLTGKGIDLKACGSIDKYEEKYIKKKKRSFLDMLFFKRQPDPADKLLLECYE